MKLSIGIIDDELHAIETLIYDLIELLGNEVNILFSETDPFDGARSARTKIPDVLFLDIEMPGLSGIELYKLIDDLNIRVVFTTSCTEISFLAKKSRAFGYLSKPIMIEELDEVLNRLLLAIAMK
jgi:two-component system, LytTR family, response regulator